MIVNNTIKKEFSFMVNNIYLTPTYTWDDVTIGMLQEILEFKTENPVEQAAHNISVITKTPYEKVQEWKLNELYEIDLSFLNDTPDRKVKYNFKHKGRRFRLIKNAKEMKAHHFIELQEMLKGDLIENLHVVIALLSNRVNWWGSPVKDDYDWKVENFKDLPCPQFYAYAVFFSLLFPQLLNATLTYLKEKKVPISQELLDGYRSLTESQEEEEQSGIKS